MASGEPVYDRHDSHLHNGVAKLLPEMLAQVSGGKEFIEQEYDFGRIVGETVCVGTGENDQIVYAKRPRRNGHTRFVRNRQAEPCSTALAVLKKDRVRPVYYLITAFIGKKAGLEPWDNRATSRDREFWKHHALVYGSEEIVPGTEAEVCPW